MNKKPTKPNKKAAKKEKPLHLNMTFEEALKLAAASVVKNKGK